jgi:DNA-binding NarL/FixJ family response regulator
MPVQKKTILICYDDHRSFTEDIRKRFSDSSRYNVVSFHTRQDFITCCKTESDNRECKIAIIGVPDTREQFQAIEDLTLEIKRIDQKTGLILLAQGDKMDDLKKIIKFNIDSYIIRNTNMILRLHNAVKKIISEHSIVLYKKRRNFALYVLSGFLFLSLAAFLVACLLFPECF